MEKSGYVLSAQESVRRHESSYIRLAKDLFDHPELRFRERYACEMMTSFLEAEGFTVERPYGGLPTAFRASFGSGGPCIGFLGEYDALPGLCQEPGVREKKKREGAEDVGHGCGHHLLGTGLIGAVVALKEELARNGMEGRAVFYGCPAEEGGSGKVWMLKAGAFTEADVLFSWHPEGMNRISPNDVLATIVHDYAFHGKASHAASAPELGRSALEAAELMGVGLGYLREHLPDTARVHYAYLNAGASATNVIQPEAAVSYQIRSPHLREARQIAERIDDLARGAALMTGTKVDIRFKRAASELRVNEVLGDVLYEALLEIGRNEPDAESENLAKALYETLPLEARGEMARKAQRMYGALGSEVAHALKDTYLSTTIYPRHASAISYCASTDVGDVSFCKPLGFLNVACFVKDIPLHTWQSVSFGLSSFALDGMLTAAMVIGASAIRLCHKPELVSKAKKEWEEQNREEPYVCPIPEGVEPEKV